MKVDRRPASSEIEALRRQAIVVRPGRCSTLPAPRIPTAIGSSCRGVQDRFAASGSPDHLFAEHGLTDTAIARAAREILRG